MPGLLRVTELLRQNQQWEGDGEGGRGGGKLHPPNHTHTHTHTKSALESLFNKVVAGRHSPACNFI